MNPSSSSSSNALRAVLLALAALIRADAQGVVDKINFPAYLARHDPLWSWGETCTTGYTQLPNTIRSGGTSCPVHNCTSAATCVEESAVMCDACVLCASFGLSPDWHNGLLPQLYGDVQSVANPQWTTYVKGGPIMRNHSSCTTVGSKIATAWEDSAFIGNGLTGALLRVNAADPSRELLLEIGRVDVWDRRAQGSEFAVNSPMFDRPRLPIGAFHLRCAGTITSGSMRISLLEGQLRGSLATTLGNVSFVMYTHQLRWTTLMQWNATGGEVPDSNGAGGLQVSFVAQQGNVTRSNPPAGFKYNPLPQCVGQGEPGGAWQGAVGLCYQPLLAGPGYATAWTTSAMVGGGVGAFVTVWHTANDWPSPTSNSTAVDMVTSAVAAASASWGAWTDIEAEHEAVWDSYWRQSFISIPDTRMEGTYVMQIYKFGCAARPGSPNAIDLMGPWWQKSSWELIWTDMNLPVTYWALYTAGRFGIAETLVNLLTSNVTQLSANIDNGRSDGVGYASTLSYDLVSPLVVKAGVQLGNFPWIVQVLAQHARFTANDTMMKSVVFPFAKGAAAVYLAFAVTLADGKLHLPPTASPEYPYPHGPTNDTHYDLALFQWCLRTLLQIDEEYSIHDPLVPIWTSALSRLAPLPVGKNGYNVSLGVGFDVAHRHFSHLFAMYPLHLTAWEDADGGTNASRALYTQSLDRWTGLTCTGGSAHNTCPNGFTFVGAASMSAAMTTERGRVDAAAGYINGFITSGQMHASTLYSESHQPCFESPVGIAGSMQELLLQSWGGRVRVFPALPSTWTQAVIHQLAAEGGLRISALFNGSATQWISITAVDYTSIERHLRSSASEGMSLSNGITRDYADTAAAVTSSTSDATSAAAAASTRLVTLRTDGTMASPFATVPAGVQFSVSPFGDIVFNLTVGESVSFYSDRGGPPPSMIVEALAGNSSQYNYWGMH